MNSNRRFNKLDGCLLLTLVSMFAILYTLSTATSISGYADAEDLLLAAFHGGQAHPPGYVLLVSPLHFILRFFPQHVVQVGHLWSTFFQVLNVSLFYLLVRFFAPHSRPYTQLGVFIATLFFGIHGYFWSSATTLEVFAYGLFWILSWLVLFLFVERKLNFTRVLVLGFFTGIVLSYHPLNWLLVIPAWIVLGTFSRKRRVEWVGLTLLSFLLFIFLYSYWGGTSNYLWQQGSGLLTGLTNYLRLAYSEGGSAAETYTSILSFQHSWQSIIIFFQQLVLEYGVIAILLGILGLFWWYKSARRWYWWGIMVLILGLFFSAYMKFPLGPQLTGTEFFSGMMLRLRLLYPWHLVTTLLAGVGIVSAMEWCSKKGRRPTTLLIGILMSFATMMTLHRFQHQDVSSSNFTELYTKKILAELPENSVLIVDSDLIFSFLVQQHIQRTRKDVTIVPARFKIFSSEELDTEINGFQSAPTDFDIALRIAKETLKHSVFLYAPSVTLLDQLGVEGNPFYAVVSGYLIEVRRTPKMIDTYDYGLSASLASQESDKRQWATLSLKAHLTSLHTMQAYFAARSSHESIAQAHSSLALKLADLRVDQLQATAAASLATDHLIAQGNYLAYRIPSYDEYITLAEKAYGAGNVPSYQFYLERALFLDPYREEVTDLLKKLYLETGQTERARVFEGSG